MKKDKCRKNKKNVDFVKKDVLELQRLDGK